MRESVFQIADSDWDFEIANYRFQITDFKFQIQIADSGCGFKYNAHYKYDFYGCSKT